MDELGRNPKPPEPATPAGARSSTPGMLKPEVGSTASSHAAIVANAVPSAPPIVVSATQSVSLGDGSSGSQVHAVPATPGSAPVGYGSSVGHSSGNGSASAASNGLGGSSVAVALAAPGTGSSVSVGATGSSVGGQRIIGAGPVGENQTVISAPPPPPEPTLVLHPFEIAKSLRGESLDHFVLEDFVGVGGMGTVFRAKDTLLNRTVAVKVLSGDQARDTEVRKRFRKEAQSAARLDHENIARVFYIGEARQLPYIVFEFIEGINVRDLISKRGRVSLADAVSYTLQIAGALAHAASRDVVHRDVKPSNILITPDGRAKLVDMGLARLHQNDPQQSDLTQSGVTLGTFDYISPEQARDPRTVDVRSDMYSLGCTLYYMLTGRPPYPDGTMLQKLLSHQGEAPPDPRDTNPDVPAELAQIVQKLMAKDVTRRYQTPTELISDLMILAGGLGLRPAGPSGLVWISPETLKAPWWERHMPWMAPVAALLAAVVALEYRPTGDPLAGVRPTQGQPTVAQVQPVAKKDGGSETRPGGDPSAKGTGKGSDPRVTEGAGASTKKGETPVETDPPGTGTSNPGGTQPDGDPKTGVTQPGSSGSKTAVELPGVFALKQRDSWKTYPSLAAAYAAGRQDEQVEIELRFDGRRLEKPLTLEKNVTLRAGEGFRPVLAFQPEALQGREAAAHMLTIVGGTLTVDKVALELDIPNDLAIDRWAIFRTRGCRGLSLRDCTLTLRNSSGHLGAAFIELAPVPGSDAMMANRAATPPEPVAIELFNAVVRGEASLLRSYELQPVDLRAQNAFIAIGKPFQLLQARGGQMAPRTDSHSRISLDRVTAVVRGGLIRLDSEAGFPPLAPEITVKNSVLVGEHTFDREAGREDASPLVEQIGVDSITAARAKDRLQWTGERVAYARFHSLWRVSPTSEEPQDMSFAGWQEFWMLNEAGPKRLDTFDWAKPLPKNDLSVTTLTPDQFQLADGATELGIDLPRLPASPAPAAQAPAPLPGVAEAPK